MAYSVVTIYVLLIYVLQSTSENLGLWMNLVCMTNQTFWSLPSQVNHGVCFQVYCKPNFFGLLSIPGVITTSVALVKLVVPID